MTTGHRTIGSWWLGTAWLALAVALPLFAWLTPGPGEGYLAALIVLTICYSAARLTRLIIDGVPRIVAGIFWFFVYVTAGVVPLAQIHTGLYPNLMDHDQLVPSEVMVLLACVSFDVGAVIWGSKRRRMTLETAPPSEPQLPKEHRSVGLPALRWMSAMAILGTLYYIKTLGGIGVFFESRSDLAGAFDAAGLRQGSQAGSALTLAFGQVPLIIVTTAWLVHYTRNKTTRTLGAQLWLLLLFGLNLIVNNPISNARYWFLAAVIGYLYARPRLGASLYRFTLIGAVVASLVAFPYSDYFRRSAADRGPLHIGPLADTISTKDYDQSVMTANGLWYVANFGHTWGHQLLSSAFFWVPRSVWPGKSLDTGVLIGNHLNAGTNNLSSPLWVEFYFDFGHLGVAVGFLLLGIAVRRLDDLFVRMWTMRDNRTYVLQLLLPFLAGYSLIILRGPLLQSMSRLAVIVGVCWLLGAGQRDRSPSPLAPTSPPLKEPTPRRT